MNSTSYMYRISSIRRRPQIVAASFTSRSFIVAALELSPHILIRAHLPYLEAVSACLRCILAAVSCTTDCRRTVYQEPGKASNESRQR